MKRKVVFISPIFQFTASYEADLVVQVSFSVFMIFQFTASYEADQYPVTGMAEPVDLSIHSLIRG